MQLLVFLDEIEIPVSNDNVAELDRTAKPITWYHKMSKSGNLSAISHMFE